MEFAQNNYQKAYNKFFSLRTLYGAYDVWVVKGTLKAALCKEKQQNYNDARTLYELVVKNHGDDEFGEEARIGLERVKR